MPLRGPRGWPNESKGWAPQPTCAQKPFPSCSSMPVARFTQGFSGSDLNSKALNPMSPYMSPYTDPGNHLFRHMLVVTACIVDHLPPKFSSKLKIIII